MRTSIAFPALVAAIASASPLRVHSPMAVKEAHHVPSKWKKVGQAPADHIINLKIGLKPSQFDDLERHLYEVSDPDHERYGKHLTTAEIHELIRPAVNTLQLVHDWLEDSGISKSNLAYSLAKDWIKISLPVNAIENMLDTEYSIYQHDDGSHLIRAPKWSLPEHLHEHIDVIQPTSSFFQPKQQKSMVMTVGDISDFRKQYKPPTYTPAENLSAVCNTSLVTPLCLRTLYGTVNYTAQSADKNSIGINNFLGESNNRSDTKIFLQQYRPEAAAAAYEFKVNLINNGTDEQTQATPEELANGKGLEGNLDSETVLGIAWPTPLVTFNTGGSPPFQPDLTTPTNTNEPYLDWLEYVLAKDDLPQVFTTSYADDEQTVPPSYAKSVCNGFAQLGARGISLFFGSGDSGVGAAGKCVSNDGSNSSTFLASFPSTCPYITSVGGTKFIPEVVASDTRNGYVSGGGFSRYFSRPSYQDSAVSAYVQSLGKSFSDLYNSSGRGYPDLAAQGYRYATIWNGTLQVLDGTSAATPAAAAIFALVNDALLTKGKPPMGFLNPWLYKNGYKAFTDVTSGSAAGCNSTGFPALKGWDAVTGFGTPYFPKIKEDVCSSR